MNLRAAEGNPRAGRTRSFAAALILGALCLQPLAAEAMDLTQDPAACPVNMPGTTVRFAVIGDYGMASQAEADVAQLVDSWAPDLIVTVGDNNYPAGSAETLDVNLGQYYHEYICPYKGTYGAGSEQSRFLPAMGNHDWDSGNGKPYLDYFVLPGNERYYDFVRGPVHFFVLDSDWREPDGIGLSSKQAAWLKGALALSRSPWDIVLLHHAPFSSGAGHGSDVAVQWPYEQWGAEAVIAGHEHSYERILFDEFPYFVNGLGGSTRYDFAPTPIEGSEVRYNADFGAMRVDATRTSIQFQFITRGGVLIDSYTLTQPQPALAPLDPPRLYFERLPLTLDQPLLITHAGDGSGRLFVAEKEGRIRIFKDDTLLPTPYLDIADRVRSTGGEEGLLGLAFHPDHKSNRLFYVAYTNLNGDLQLSRFQARPMNRDQADPHSERRMLTIPHPANSNHNGGTLAFGPDGHLFWSVGDGGGVGDASNNAQNLGSLLGKILRLDVNFAEPYAVPADNPFLTDGNDQTLPEIWAYGLRNPWRMAFDDLTGDLYIGDVGQGSWEEIDFQPASSTGGENYGWRVMEGNHCHNPREGCDDTGTVRPAAEYSHDWGCSVTGGHVYRGLTFPSLEGYYFYADFCSGNLWWLNYDAGLAAWTSALLLDTPYNVSSFGKDEAGHLYLTHYGAGKVYMLGYKETAPFANVKPHPMEGAQVCLRPTLGVEFSLTEQARAANGSFDQSKVALRLDGVKVTGSATVRQDTSIPTAQAAIRYVPPADLTAGQHLLTFTYPTRIGEAVAAWHFNAAAVTCTSDLFGTWTEGTAANSGG